MSQNLKQSLIKEFMEKCGMWFKDFHPNNLKLMESYLTDVLEKQGEKEIVICAAIRIKNGEVVRGHRHADAIYTAQRMGFDLVRDLSIADQGFVTSRNRYVSREEGRILQDAAGIPSADKEHPGYKGKTLFSEDLY